MFLIFSSGGNAVLVGWKGDYGGADLGGGGKEGMCVCVYVFQKIDVKMLLSICNFFPINKTNGFGSSWSLAGVWSLI